MQFILNNWYPLAFSSAIDRTPKRLTLTEQNIVLYRDTKGGIVALEDRCPHRFTPLSLGKVKGDAIECGYHGMTFDSTGRCIKIPGQEKIPANACVRSYPVRENLGVVWVWPGKPELAEQVPVFDIPEYHDSQNWTAVHGQSLLIKANYADYADNLVDPAHVSFVHLSTLGNAGEGEQAPVKHDQEGNTVVAYRWTLNAEAVPLVKKLGLFEGKVDRWQYYYFHAPSLAVIDFGTCPVGAIKPESKERNGGIRMFVAHFITPVDSRTSIDHWLYVRNFALGNDKVSETMNAQFVLAFNEDKAVLEAIQLEQDVIGESRKPQRIAIDGGVVRLRRLLDELLAKEASEGQLRRHSA